jgi:hypothetical protein
MSGWTMITMHKFLPLFLIHPRVQNKHLIHTHAIDELNLLSSLNTLGYTEFDIPCDISSLERIMFCQTELSLLTRNNFYAVGNFDGRGEFFVQKAFICSNMKSSFGPPQHNKMIGCTNANDILHIISRHVFLQQEQHLQSEHC